MSSNYSDFYGQFTYRDPLLYFKIENLDWWQHRDWVIRFDPFLKKFINGLDVSIFEEKPIFVPDILESDTEVESPEDGDKTIDENKLTLWNDEEKDILLDWNQEDWDDLMIKMYDSARTHKWCIIVLYDEPPYWYVFTYREIMEIEYNESDVPIRAHAMWSKILPLPTSFQQHDIWINLLESKTDELAPPHPPSPRWVLSEPNQGLGGSQPDQCGCQMASHGSLQRQHCLVLELRGGVSADMDFLGGA
ncbi:hypothetical protein LCGC14_3045320 [marine sediment metagenome]|uniref:Uncharacterized protein n=1 Tax=marine sediment metagenome TaxID=412755 RepID=A0A0F8XBP2_9ZZZZ